MPEEYRARFVQRFNGPRRQVRHGDVTLHVVLEKRLNGRIVDKTRLGSIDLDMLDSVNDRDEFWKITDLYLSLFDLSLIHISEPTRRTPISYAVFCLKKKKK